MIQPIWICWCLVNWIVIIQGQSECGIKSNPPGSARIVGGEEVNYVKYPWYTGLFLSSNPRQLVCGGTLITPNHVLTAAHCFKPFFENVKNNLIEIEDIFIVKLGISNVCVAEDTQEVFSTSAVYIHERYFDDLRYFDIAIIELSDTVEAMPCCLPKEMFGNNNRPQGPAVIFGLGKESSSSFRLPCHPREANVTIQTDEACKNMLAANGQDPSRLQGAFCAGNGTADTCQGDDGGPLQIMDSDGSYTVLGITSFGFGCARKNTFGVYTDVSHYLDWIHNKTMAVNGS